MSEGEKRAGPRVRFDHDRPAQMMAIDGTWRRDCIVENIGEGGAAKKKARAAGPRFPFSNLLDRIRSIAA